MPFDLISGQNSIKSALDFFTEVEFADALCREDKENPLLDDEQLDRLRLCVKLLTSIQTNLADLENGPLKIRYNQLLGLQNLITFLQQAGEGDRLGYFRQPTGAGKTILMAIIARLCNVKTLFLVPKINLLGQTVDALKKLGFSEDEIGMVGGGNFQTGKKLTVCTYQSLPSLMRESENGYELTICDEAHRGLGDKTVERLDNMGTTRPDEDPEIDFGNVEQYVPKKALRLGFTATPDLRDKSVEQFFKKLIHSVTFAELVRSGILVKFKLVHTEGKIYKDDLQSETINTEKEAEILEREDIYEKLINKYLETTQKLGKLKTAVFCANIAECDKFAGEAHEKGLKSLIVTSREAERNPDALQQAEAAIMRGEIDFIVTVEKLGEGWDFPPLEAVILARATLSPMRIIQPIGRAARSYTDEHGVEKEFSCVFETEWEMMGARSEKIPTDELERGEADPETDDEERAKAGGRRKPLNVAQAFVRLGETDIEGICEGMDGEAVRYEAYQEAPKGWITNGAVSESLGVVFNTTERIAEDYRLSNPEWFKIYLNVQNHPYEHYAPELVAAIRLTLASREQAPEGWMTNSAVSESLGVDFNTTRRIADGHRQTNPECFKMCLDKSKKLAVHYAPELVAAIRSVLASKGEQAPEGWFTNMAIGKALKAGEATIMEIAETYRESKPEWFQMYLNPQNHPYEHYAPELIAAIRSVLASKGEQVPEGWMTNYGLAQVAVQVSKNTIREMADGYRETNPEWFKMYLNRDRRSLEHYAPELIAAILSAIASRGEQAPEGWLAATALAKDLKAALKTVQKMADGYREINPEWFKMYISKKKRSLEYYAPELIDAIRSTLASRGEQVPEGWMTKGSIAQALKAAEKTIKKIADGYRETNPDWFQTYLDKGKRPFEYCSPDLIAAIRKALKKE